MRPSTLGAWLALAHAALLLPTTSALAQEPAAADARQAGAPSCLRKEAGQQGGFTILVDTDSVTNLQARGFVARPCAGNADSFETYRTQMCRFARRAPQEARDRFAASFSVSPTELCAMADKALGPERAGE